MKTIITVFFVLSKSKEVHELHVEQLMALKNVKTQAVTSKKELRGKVLLNWIQSPVILLQFDDITCKN